MTDVRADAFSAPPRESERERAGKLKTQTFQLLKLFLSDYDAYGWLGMYRMHLLGSAPAWQGLKDAWGLDGAEAGHVVAQAIATLVDAARARASSTADPIDPTKDPTRDREVPR